MPGGCSTPSSRARRWLRHDRLFRVCLITLVVTAGPWGGANFSAQTVSTRSEADVIDLRPTPRAVPPEYFGIHIHRALTAPDSRRSPWPAIGVGSWRLWDADVSWADLQPGPKDWRFSRLDSLVALAHSHHVAVYLTLGRTPRWASSRPLERSAYGEGEQSPPSDIALWTVYVDTLSKRYKGRIAAYELWNEPNVPGFFSGSIEDLVAMARVAYSTIKRADPMALVISPSPAGGAKGVEWLSRYLVSGGAEVTDAIGFHPYATNDTPESIVYPLLAASRLASSTRGGIPLWVTEVGWFIQNSDLSVHPGAAAGGFDATVLSDTTGAAYVARALILARCAGADRVMWYAWDNYRMGLADPGTRHGKVSARAYQTTARWMVGATVDRCRRDSLGRWQVSLRSPHGRSHTIVWNQYAAVSINTTIRAHLSAIGDVRPADVRRRLVQIGMPFALESRDE